MASLAGNLIITLGIACFLQAAYSFANQVLFADLQKTFAHLQNDHGQDHSSMQSGLTSHGPPGRSMTVGEISARDGVSLSVQDDVMEDAPLMSGSFLQYGLGPGLWVHGGNLIEERAFDIQSSIGNGLACIFFLQGQVETQIGGRSFGFRAAPGRPIQAATLMNARDESFRRHSSSRQRVTHLVINVSPEWLAQHGHDLSGEPSSASRLFGENLTEHRWTVPQRLQGLIQGIMAPDDGSPLRRLYAEAQAIQIIAESIAHATTGSSAQESGIRKGRRAAPALQRAKNFIESCSAAEMSVADIARQAAVSVSGLQALFRQHEGCGVFEYVRRVRLDQARDGLIRGELDIEQASRIAGYGHAANFATAFRRRFQISPRDIVIGTGR